MVKLADDYFQGMTAQPAGQKSLHILDSEERPPPRQSRSNSLNSISISQTPHQHSDDKDSNDLDKKSNDGESRESSEGSDEGGNESTEDSKGSDGPMTKETTTVTVETKPR